MTGNSGNGSGNRARSGAQTLLLLAAPLNALILQTLAGGPKQQSELRRAVGSPAQTTLRAQLNRLARAGAIEKHRHNRFPGVLDYELTGSGVELLAVAASLEDWLEQAVERPLSLDRGAPKAAIKALTEGWSSTIMRALSAGPLSLTELDRLIGSLSYPALERRLAALRLSGLVEAQPANGRGKPYGVTEWLRRAMAPLATAARWERRHLAHQTAPLGRLDIEATFLLTVPLLHLPPGLSGTCQVAAEISNGSSRRLAGATVEVQRGQIASCATQLRSGVDSWAHGSPVAWLNALIECDLDHLELGGGQALSAAVLRGLHETLFELPGDRSSIKP